MLKSPENPQQQCGFPGILLCPKQSDLALYSGSMSKIGEPPRWYPILGADSASDGHGTFLHGPERGCSADRCKKMASDLPHPTRETVEALRGLNSQEWGMYAFSRDPLCGRAHPKRQSELIGRATGCGRQTERDFTLRYGKRTARKAFPLLRWKRSGPQALKLPLWEAPLPNRTIRRSRQSASAAWPDDNRRQMIWIFSIRF